MSTSTKQYIEIKKLSDEFYRTHNLIEMLDAGQALYKRKGRGYGVLLVKVKEYKFAIPVRSKMKMWHKHNFTTRIHFENGQRLRHGLDYEKALIIKDDKFIERNYILNNKSDYEKIVKSHIRITKEFTKFVEKYIDAVQNNDQNILREYEHSTLQNYHNELGC